MDAKRNSSFAAKIKKGVRNMRSTFNILFYVKFEDDNLAFVRDIFVFVCFTALSFIDVKNLTTDNIVDVNGDKWIISKRHKTNIPFQVKLMDVPLQIIDRYKHLREDKLVFGKMRSTFGRLARPRTTGLCARN